MPEICLKFVALFNKIVPKELSFSFFSSVCSKKNYKFFKTSKALYSSVSQPDGLRLTKNRTEFSLIYFSAERWQRPFVFISVLFCLLKNEERHFVSSFNFDVRYSFGDPISNPFSNE